MILADRQAALALDGLVMPNRPQPMLAMCPAAGGRHRRQEPPVCNQPPGSDTNTPPPHIQAPANNYRDAAAEKTPSAPSTIARLLW